MDIKVTKVHTKAVQPKYDTTDSTSFTICAVDDIVIHERALKLFRTGLIFDIPKGYELEIRLRPILATQTKLRIPEGLAVFDSNHNNQEISFYLENITKSFGEDFKIKAGQKVALGRFRKVDKIEFKI